MTEHFDRDGSHIFRQKYVAAFGFVSIVEEGPELSNDFTRIIVN